MAKPEFQGVRPGTVAMIKVGNNERVAVVEELAGDLCKAIAVLGVDPGRYVVVPISLWEATVRKAMVDPAEPPAVTELEVNAELPPTRQQRRAKLRN